MWCSNLLHGPMHWPMICCDSRNSVDTQRHAYLWCALSCYSAHWSPLNSRTESFKIRFRFLVDRLLQQNCLFLLISIFGFRREFTAIYFPLSNRMCRAVSMYFSHWKSLNTNTANRSFSLSRRTHKCPIFVFVLVTSKLRALPFLCETQNSSIFAAAIPDASN